MMSEYQYYEFLALDRRLTDEQMRELRAISSRAEITPTSFVNEYNFGDFRGDELELLDRYFDLLVYVANWGTHRFMVRLPKDAIDVEAAKRYGGKYDFTIHMRRDAVILDFTSQEEGGDCEEGEGYMRDLLPVRTELLRGDERALYFGWLLRVQSEDATESDIEPPVPPGLGELSIPLQKLAEFLRIDEDLLAMAAERSAAAVPTDDESGALAEWIEALPAAEKDALLVKLIDGSEPDAGTKLLARFRASRRKKGSPRDHKATGRTAGGLLEAADRRREEREREEARRRAEVKARKQREHAKARATYLDELAPREEGIWKDIESYIQLKQTKAYDLAVARLLDLRDLAVRAKRTVQFEARLTDLLDRYSTRPALLARVERAKLR